MITSVRPSSATLTTTEPAEECTVCPSDFSLRKLRIVSGATEQDGPAIPKGTNSFDQRRSMAASIDEEKLVVEFCSSTVDGGSS
ncbi:hypothetical protein T265_03903 [Opisthorchis viverrini]|uniref:Uncharacterized protein n=1 Tax=Opisthorchis viverrini TaxID=6198 RepID=A0A074ZPU0_OPIVI|nr:hypothetical protein T265_03903 [Opisthorchis viverrini]KER29438.1 hypothetical protein T265_03903 [Opisthorchis viverrini]